MFVLKNKKQRRDVQFTRALLNAVHNPSLAHSSNVLSSIQPDIRNRVGIKFLEDKGVLAKDPRVREVKFNLLRDPSQLVDEQGRITKMLVIASFAWSLLQHRRCVFLERCPFPTLPTEWSLLHARTCNDSTLCPRSQQPFCAYA